MKTALVVIAAYRAQSFLPVCFASVVNQVLPEGWRLAVVVASDNCDTTKRLMEYYNWPNVPDRVRTYFRETLENVGPYIVRNSVIEDMRDEFQRLPEALVIFDADDIMHPLYLASALPLVEEHKGLVGTARTEFEHGTGKLLGSYGFTNGVCAFHRDVWSMLGGFRPWRIAADHDFLRRAETAGVQIVLDRGPMFSRRVHPGSLTQTPETVFGGTERTRLKALTERLIEQGEFFVKPEVVQLCRVQRGDWL